MELRSMFKSLFTKQQQQPSKHFTRLETLNSFTPIFTNFGSNAYSNELVRSCIHAIATHVGKTKAKHVGFPNSKLEYLLTVRPNLYMNAFDMFYKTITQLYINNNAYIVIQKDDSGTITGFYPINASTIDSLESNGEYFVKFSFMGGQQLITSYSDIVHLRRHFNSNDLYGDANVINNTLELLNTTDQGISNAVKSSNNLKGLLQFEGVLKPEDLKNKKDAFVADYMNINNAGGLGALDAKMTYIPLQNDPKMVDDKQMSVIEEKIFKYYNINKKIIMNEFDENIWNAFYEGVVEPICLQLSNELTHKCFTERERGFGNKIMFTSNNLNYASNQTKVNMCKELVAMGIFSLNEARELFNLEPREQDKTIISLNYVDAAKQNQYQLGEKEGEQKDDNSK